MIEYLTYILVSANAESPLDKAISRLESVAARLEGSQGADIAIDSPHTQQKLICKLLAIDSRFAGALLYGL